MEKLDRTALKQKFQKGRMPSEQDFSNLIDSMVNILEEGFDKSSREGLKLSQLMDSGRLLSFYENIAVDTPKWFLELGTSDSKLHFGTPQLSPVLSLHTYRDRENPDQTQVGVGINNANPQTTLDVAGTIASEGRRGKSGELAAPADGEWHDITAALTGCEAFEIVAGVGGQDNDGKYALLHAFALNAFNGDSSINHHHAHFGKKCNRIELRWIAAPEQSVFHYKLQMRVKCAYYTDDSTKIWIKYHITRLWFDPLMLRSNQSPD